MDTGHTNIDEIGSTPGINLSDDERDYVARVRITAMKGRRITQVMIDMPESPAETAI